MRSHSVAPHLLATKSAALPKQTLEDALAQGCALQQLWAHTNALQTDGDAVRTDASKHTSVLLLQHILAELAQTYAPELERPVHETGTYALHMRLPMGDYFTNAVRLDQERARTLETAHAELVQVAPSIGKAAPLTLGERRVPRARPPPQRTEGYQPTAFLSFGPYCSSFGPTYDSAGAALDVHHTELVAQWRARRNEQLDRRWGVGLARRVDRAFGERDSEMDTGMDAEVAPLADAIAALDPDLDPTLLEAGVASLEVDAQMHTVWAQLTELQELQWLRTRLAYDGTPCPPAMQEEEHACASDVLAALTQLLLKAPPTPKNQQHSALWQRTIVVLAHTLDADRSDVLPGYWGTLPDAQHSLRSQAQLPAAPTPQAPPQATWGALLRPQMLADTSTARWDAEHAPGAVAAAAQAHAASPSETVQRALAMPSYNRPPPPPAGVPYGLGTYAATHAAYPRSIGGPNR